jgi:hypothetical protein
VGQRVEVHPAWLQGSNHHTNTHTHGEIERKEGSEQILIQSAPCSASRFSFIKCLEEKFFCLILFAKKGLG